MSGNYDRLPFSPYFIFKDLITIFLFMLVLSLFVFFMPNVLGDSENYVMADPMKTPAAIVPEWYLLPFYAILRSIPNKLLGVIAMFFAILILLLMPFLDISKLKGIQFKPFNKFVYFLFISNFIILMILGAKHVENPFIEFGQNSTVLYFSYFLIIIPVISIIENFSFKITDFSFIKLKNRTESVTKTKWFVKLPGKFYINLYNNYATKYMLFSVIMLNNGTVVFTTLNSNNILYYFKSFFNKISVIKLEFGAKPGLYNHIDIPFLNTNFNKFTHSGYKLANYIENNRHTVKGLNNINIILYNMGNKYSNVLSSEILNIYYNNRPIFACLLAFFLYKVIFAFTKYSYRPRENNISVYTNTSNVTLCELQNQLSTILDESNRLLSQLDNFINRFNTFIVDNNINIITDSQGNMSMDIPSNLDDSTAFSYTNRVHTLDNLIRNHVNRLEQLVLRGNNLENDILYVDSSYNKQFKYISDRLIYLKNSYKHV